MSSESNEFLEPSTLQTEKIESRYRSSDCVDFGPRVLEFCIAVRQSNFVVPSNHLILVVGLLSKGTTEEHGDDDCERFHVDLRRKAFSV
ncbi:hypothetical protein QQZ08_011266 [Neonectria magnoliae]|uniref:Uncharacterized protein n=1 Tax=Neonectria magnoliae TaxID=2732573 RepID=A0ABR1HB84_9HYPO